MIPVLITLGILAALVLGLTIYDLLQKKHAILHNFPVIGHLRYILETIGYGSLGSTAVTALNRGCDLAGCLHNTGEGGISRHHLHGADLVLQLGTAYFACRNADGGFSMERLLESVGKHPQIKAIEIKLSQGAKPGLGGLLPKEKITPEIAEARGIPMDRDCHSPAGHTAFDDVDSMLDFIEAIAEATGLPVGLKSAVGESAFWEDLADLIAETDRAPDFINIDGGEGGTGAAPLVHTDHVSLPFKIGFARVHGIFRRAGVADHIVWGGSGKLGFPEQAILAMALGCDLIHVGREAMLSIGCIQAQRCHTGHCPAGVATHNKWLMGGLDPTLKSARLANYIITLRKELRAVACSAGLAHPSDITPAHIEILNSGLHSQRLDDLLASKG